MTEDFVFDGMRILGNKGFIVNAMGRHFDDLLSRALSDYGEPYTICDLEDYAGQEDSLVIIRVSNAEELRQNFRYLIYKRVIFLVPDCDAKSSYFTRYEPEPNMDIITRLFIPDSDFYEEELIKRAKTDKENEYLWKSLLVFGNLVNTGMSNGLNPSFFYDVADALKNGPVDILSYDRFWDSQFLNGKFEIPNDYLTDEEDVCYIPNFLENEFKKLCKKIETRKKQ